MSKALRFQLSGGAAEIYEKVMVPLWFGRWAEQLLDVAALQPGEVVLDVACGTGVTTRLAKQSVGETGGGTGLDINAPMLQVARDVAAGLEIEWIESDVSDSGLASDSFDAVISQHGYHYFPDKVRALAELRRILSPGGRIVMSIWNGHSAYTHALCDAVERHISPEVASKQRGQRLTPSPDNLKTALHDAGFKDAGVKTQTLEISVPVAREFVPLHLGSMPIAAAFHALGEAEKQNLVNDVEEALSAYAVGDRLVYTDTVNVAFGRK